MIQIAAAVLMWLLVLCLLPGVRRRRDHSVLTAAVTISVAMTLNIDQVYSLVDAALGGRNYVDLLANVSMVVGIYFLSRAIIRAATPDEARERRDTFGAVLLGVVTVGLAFTFSLIATQSSSTRFMLDYGGQVPAALYSAIQFVYIGYVVSVTGVTCVRFRSEMSRPYYRVAFTFIGIGCAIAVLLASLVLVMDILHLQVRLDAMRAISPAYDALVVAAMAFLCVGLAIPPVARRVLRHRESVTEDELVRGLRVVWDKTAGKRQDVRLQLSTESQSQQDQARRLHRMLVEVQDALLVEPGLATSLDIHELRVLSAAENYLAGPIEHRTSVRRVRGSKGHDG
ncbi:MAB_1171c family putative transporter [Paenarthrobacter nicotinovorans]|uniref:MAB_1171c family putative transporter n=1 Tax=Paenarthrobacter nicotinovorans TaxID=29320 RepID=UPI003749D4B1